MSKKSLYTAAALSVMSLCWGEAVFAGKFGGELDCTRITNQCLEGAKESNPNKLFLACSNFTVGSNGGHDQLRASTTCETLANTKKMEGMAQDHPMFTPQFIQEQKTRTITACKTACHEELGKKNRCDTACPE